MRLAVFTSEFPSRVSTFFARDLRALFEAGISLDVFPFYPLEADLWQYVPDDLNEEVLPRDHVHHLTIAQSMREFKSWQPAKLRRFLQDAFAISGSALRSNIEQFVKTEYIFPKAWAWAMQYPSGFDHVLGYWGNYASTCAYLYQRLTDQNVPFSIFLHAGVDLYLNRVFLRQKLLAAQNILICSHYNQQYLRDLYPDIYDAIAGKIRVFYHGIDFKQFEYVVNKRPDFTCLAVGRLAKTKNFEQLLYAAQELHRRGLDIQVEIVGDGEAEASLKQLAETLQLGDHVRFRGWLHPSEVQEAMKRATLLVHPSHSPGDNIPNVIKEAMALGTPVIAANIAGVAEVLDGGRCGVLVKPGDVTALADAIERLLKDGALRQNIAELAREYGTQQFDMWRNGKYIAEVLRSPRQAAT
jgi:glycosyltransferase involved in cell wall biosynthesis